MKYQLLSVSAYEDSSYPLHISRASIVVEAIEALREGLIEKRKRFRAIYGIPIESRTPRLAFHEIYTGQWIGVAEYIDRDRRALVRIVIEPKYRRFVDMYRETVEFLAEELKPLASIAIDLAYGYPCIEKDIRLAAWLIDRFVESESPFTVRVVHGSRGCSLHTYRGRAVLSRRVSEVNIRFYSTLLASIAFLARSMMSIDTYVPPELEKLIKVCLEEQRKILQAILHKPVVQEALLHGHVDDVDEEILLQLVGALKPIEITRVSRGISRAFMIPSTKIYELYVLTKIVQILGGIKQIYDIHRIRTPRGIVYFNRPPKKFSRVVHRIAGRVPHPDIIVVRDDTVIIVDAKYRENLSKLELKEALRLVAYAVDLARDHRLRAVVACLSKDLKNDVVVAKLDGVEIEILFVEVSPESSVRELENAVLS